MAQAGYRMKDMKAKTKYVVVAALLLSAVVGAPESSASGRDPALHPPGGRIEFDRKCADEDPYRVKAYARMESLDGRGRAVAMILVGYPDMGGEAIWINVRLQRLKIDAGKTWRNVPYTIRLLANHQSLQLKGAAVGSFHDRERALKFFRTGDAGTADWITFVEPGEEADGAENFYHTGPDMRVAVADLGVSGTTEEIELALEIQNQQSAEVVRLSGPLLRVPERVWAMSPPDLRPLGLAETLNPIKEGGLFRFLGRAWKYRKCIEERRAAKRYLGRYLIARIDRISRKYESPAVLAGLEGALYHGRYC